RGDGGAESDGDARAMSGATSPVRIFAPGTVSRDAVWFFVYTAALRVSTLTVSIALARLAGSRAAGAFGIALQVTALASMLAVFSLPQSLAKHLAESENPIRRRALLRTAALLIL